MKRIILLLLCMLLLSVSACSGEKSAAREIFAMDTVIDIETYGEGAENAAQACQSEITRLEKLFSRTLESSDIYILNTSGAVSAQPETLELISAALEIRERTGGLFDITIAPVMDAWGFLGDVPAVPEKETLAAAMRLTGSGVTVSGSAISLDAAGAEIDLGGIAKGYTGDRLAELVRQNGADSALISLGGNVVAVGEKKNGEPWRVAIRDPENASAYAGIVKVKDKSVVTSGGYERNFTENGTLYHHIIDPRTGSSADSGLLSVTVVSENGTLADALSTALFIMGEDAAVRHWREYGDFEMILITADGRVLATDGLEFEMSDGGRSYETIHNN